ncbi:hypothetical protein KNU71_gp102 [Streptomyces phage Braelyn]|uniref:Lipoprotein n=1 Tax=Streptomyces phage Braelyn TaxID=2593356 RepID=A0A514U2C7_9CAUD|nr:hypothetical protein KNU71_gp102 [Streptomyces phage Braelyn]QDK03015.1 hypothetical protein SEA_BRAELYN_196 [Streptomyces phage Braelyn]WNM73048.1 membrane protein [Streptomyces phage Persimmon]
MNKRVATTAVSAAVAGGLVFGLAACGKDEPPKDFAKACKAAGGKTMRENDFENLGMAPMAFVAGKGGGRSSSKSGNKSKGGGLKGLFGGNKSKPKSPKVTKAPKNDGWKLAGGNHTTSKPKKNKSKKHDDNEWVCVKNGQELFDQD